MSEYTPYYTELFTANLRRYTSQRQQIRRRVERIIQAPYHNTEALADSSHSINLIGCRSARVDRNFRVVFAICEECVAVPNCEFCPCRGLTDQTIVFLTVGPHDRAYAME